MNNHLPRRTQQGILRALAQRNLDGDPAMSYRDIAGRYGVNERTVTRIFREHHCSNYERGENAGGNEGTS